MATFNSIINANKLLSLQEKLKDATGLRAKVLTNQIAKLQADAIPQANNQINPKWTELNLKVQQLKQALQQAPKNKKGIATIQYNKAVNELNITPKQKKVLAKPIVRRSYLDATFNQLNQLESKTPTTNKEKKVMQKKIKETEEKIHQYAFNKLDNAGNNYNIVFDVNNYQNAYGSRDNLNYAMQIFTGIQYFFSMNRNTNASIGIVRQGDNVPTSWITLNDNNIIEFMDKMINAITDISITGQGSEAVLINTLKDVKSIIVIKHEITKQLKNGNKKQKRGGAFFPYYNKTHFDLSKYQIFKNQDESQYEDNCLIYALRMSGCDDKTLQDFINKCKNREIPQCKLKDLCVSNNIQINLKNDKVNGTNTVYGDSDKQFNIGCIANHYFINDDIAISTYCLNNYEEVKDIPNCQYIVKKEGKYYKKKQDYLINSFKLLTTLLDNKERLLEPITLNNGLMNTIYYNKNDEITSLDYIPSNCRLIEGNKESIEKIQYEHKVFFDIETNPNGQHIPFLVRTEQEINGEWVKKEFFGYGDVCIKKFLNSLTANSLLIAHNAGGYDSTFITKFLYQYSEICRQNDVLSCRGKYFNNFTKQKYHIKIKDSLKLINMKLMDFPKCFFPKDAKLYSKEVMPYKLYTESNITKKYVEINEAIDVLKKQGSSNKDIEHFKENITKWNLTKNNKFDIIKYATIYCERDVYILRRGYETFREWMFKLTTYDIDNVITLASLSDKNLKRLRCYDGVYELSGIPQKFIMKCVVGGRCMTRCNQRFKSTKIIQDFDAVSLYPSAMSRMGFLKGVPKVINQDELSYEQLQQYDGFFVEVIATGIKTYRDFPLLSYLDEKTGVRDFTNDVVGKTFFLDKTMFEDAVKFQGITFEIKRGYYFNEGFNYTVKEVIRSMFNERVQKKKEKNPIQLAYKELLNCAYGKTILKASEFEYKFFDSYQQFINYLSYNYNYVSEYWQLAGDKYRVKSKTPINTHFNRPQVGVSILSMSKHIMNEVMCLAEDNNITIAYQDTDSMHIIADDLPILSKKFNELYNRELVGEDMGQFHSDFSLEYEDENGENQKAKNIVSVASEYLGKKCYHDKLRGEDKNGNYVYGDHTRMKGVSGDSIEHLCNLYNCDVSQLYGQLLGDEMGGAKFTFDLLCKDEDGNKINEKFIRNKDKTITNKDAFLREITFNRVQYTTFNDLI